MEAFDWCQVALWMVKGKVLTRERNFGFGCIALLYTLFGLTIYNASVKMVLLHCDFCEIPS